MTKHSIGLYLSNASNKNLILEQIISNKYLKDHINLESLKGLLHSTLTINRFIEKEIRHDKFPIYTTENKSLGSMSSGQQKKALLDYLILQKPDYIVLDDVYSNINKATQESITNTLSQLAETTLLIQLFFRKRDMLPCIKTVYTVDENNTIIDAQNAEAFKTKQTISLTNQLVLKFPQGYDETHSNINPLVLLNSVSV